MIMTASTLVSALRVRAASLAVALAVVALASAVACARSQPKKPDGPVYHGVGVVVWVSADRDSVKIKHEDIEGLMPAMTMKFVVENKTLLDGIGENDNVRFSVVEDTRGYLITELAKT